MTKLLALLAAVYSIAAIAFVFVVGLAVTAIGIAGSERAILESALLLVVIGALIAGLGRIYSYNSSFWDWKGYVPSVTKAAAARRVLNATSLVFVLSIFGTALWVSFTRPDGANNLSPSRLLSVEILLLLLLSSWNGAVALWGARVLRAQPPSWYRHPSEGRE